MAEEMREQPPDPNDPKWARWLARGRFPDPPSGRKRYEESLRFFAGQSLSFAASCETGKAVRFYGNFRMTMEEAFLASSLYDPDLIEVLHEAEADLLGWLVGTLSESCRCAEEMK